MSYQACCRGLAEYKKALLQMVLLKNVEYAEACKRLEEEEMDVKINVYSAGTASSVNGPEVSRVGTCLSLDDCKAPGA